MTLRRPVVAGNWKMHLDQAGARSLAAAVASGVGDSTRAEVVVFPSFPLLGAVAATLRETVVAWGGQDCHHEASGAHTGDVAASQLLDLGCRWVLCGHSERRRDHGEGERLVARKAHAAAAAGLAPMVCVGETLEERSAGLTRGILARQLEAVLADGPPGDFAVAYEPVWAIGTGRVATADIVEEAHEIIRSVLAATTSVEVAECTRILYGGSAKPDNVAALAAREGVDGFLVGGASLDAASFLAIIANSRFGE